MTLYLMEHLAYFAVVVAAGVFAAILGCLELGHRLARRRAVGDARGPGSATIETAVFALLGLLVAFAFSGAMQRWDVRRELVVQETNAIGTAWLRIDSLPSAAQEPLRELFRRYTDSRIAVYRLLPDVGEARAELARSEALQKEIWSYSVAATFTPEGERGRLLLLPALNEMIDITTVRTMALITHPPAVVYGVLLGLLLASSLMAGVAMTGDERPWVHMVCFAAAMSLGLYLIVDLEFPRAGLIRIDYVDQILIDLRASMK